MIDLEHVRRTAEPGRQTLASDAHAGESDDMRDAHAVAGLVHGSPQAGSQLMVGAASDQTESAADAVAARVVRQLGGSLAPLRPGGDGGIRRSTDLGGGTATVGAAGGLLDSGSSDAISRAAGSGSPLPSALRTRLEPTIGGSLDAVRIHTGPQATVLNRQMSASAFTAGKDVFFRDGMPDVGTEGGLRLLAHELAHTVQTPQRISRDFVPGNAPGRAVVKDAPEIAGHRKPPPTENQIGASLEYFAKKGGADGGKGAHAAASASKRRSKKKSGKAAGGEYETESSMAMHAGIWGGVEYKNDEEAFEVLAEVGMEVGVAGRLEGKWKREFGDVEAQIAASVAGYAGANVKASGELKVTKHGEHAGVAAGFEASAFAGAKAKEEVSMTLTSGEIGVEMGVGSEQVLGAAVDSSGSFEMTKKSIVVGGEASVSAGASLAGNATAGFRFYDRPTFSVKADTNVAAGFSAGAAGIFEMKRGAMRIKIGGDLTGLIGGGVAVDVKADLKPIAVRIARHAAKAAWKKQPEEAKRLVEKAAKGERLPWTDAMIEEMQIYRDRKIAQIKAGKADNYIKKEKLQLILNEHFPTGMVRDVSFLGMHYKIDTWLANVIHEAFTIDGEQTLKVGFAYGEIKFVQDTGIVERYQPAAKGVKGKDGTRMKDKLSY